MRTASNILQGDQTGCRQENREKLRSSQAEPGQGIKSAVAYPPVRLPCILFRSNFQIIHDILHLLIPNMSILFVTKLIAENTDQLIKSVSEVSRI